MPFCGAFPALELACHVAIRSETFHAKTFYASLAAANLSVMLLPLFVTDTASYGAARKVCYDRTFSVWNVTYLDEGSAYYNPDGDIDDVATFHLFPKHLFNSLSAVVSLFGFGVWLFFSSHQSDVAKDLDRTRTYTHSDSFPLVSLSNALKLMLASFGLHFRFF